MPPIRFRSFGGMGDGAVGGRGPIVNICSYKCDRDSMVRKRTSLGPTEYYRVLENIFRAESDVLTSVLPHAGERGRNDEERIKLFLSKVLPKRFSLGTGFIVSSVTEGGPSSQVDIVIFDEHFNSPLHRELAAFIYPIEIVYATIEVKGLLDSKQLKKSLKDIARVRGMAAQKRYVQYDSTPNGFVGMTEYEQLLPPRTFLFAYDCSGWKTLSGFKNALESALMHENEAHLHGVIVLNKGWYLYQVAHVKDGVKIKYFTENCLMRFISRLIQSISSIPMAPMSMNRYLRLD